MNVRRTPYDAFLCALAIILLSFALNESLRLLIAENSNFAHWTKRHSYLAELCFNFSTRCMWLLIAVFFARGKTGREILSKWGLNRIFTRAGVIFGFCALLQGLLEVHFVRNGMSHENASAKEFRSAGSLIWTAYFLDSAVISPIVEEAVIRGFLYRSFRESYSLVPSVALVVCFQLYFHWGLISHDSTFLLFLVVGSVTACLIREFTHSLWNCVLFHIAFNVTVLGSVRYAAIALAVLLVVQFASPNEPPAPREVKA